MFTFMDTSRVIVASSSVDFDVLTVEVSCVNERFSYPFSISEVPYHTFIRDYVLLSIMTPIMLHKEEMNDIT